MKRLIDLILIALFLGALGGGAYFIGKRVDWYSNKAAEPDSELHQVSTVRAAHQSNSNRTLYFIAGGIAIGIGTIALGSGISSLARARRRQRWHAT